MFLSRFLPSLRPTLTFGELATQWLVDAERRLRTSTLTEYRRVLHRELMPALATCRADKLTRRDFATLFEGLADRPGVGWNAHAVASSIYAWAIATCRVDGANPIDGLRKPSLEARDRALSAEEVRLVWYGVRKMADYGCIVRLLLLTGCRRAEIGKLAWSEVNLAERQLELPRTRTKNGRAHVVPLSPLALSCLPPKRDSHPHVFGRVVGVGFAGWGRCKALLDSNLTGMAPWRVHDLRRTMVTMMTELEIAPPWIVEQCVNHLGGFKGGVAGTYNRAQNLQARRDALERWSAEVGRIVGA